MIPEAQQHIAHQETMSWPFARLNYRKHGAYCVGTIATFALGISAHDAVFASPALNESPVAMTDFVDLKASSTAFNALANDHDANGDQLVLIDATAQSGAVVFTPDGLLAYSQSPGAAKADEISYVISDGRGGFDTGIIKISRH